MALPVTQAGIKAESEDSESARREPGLTRTHWQPGAAGRQPAKPRSAEEMLKL
jgi:hypothetical protein